MWWRGVLLVTVLGSAGCRLATEGLATENDFIDGAVDAASGDSVPVEDTAPLFPLEDAMPGACEGKSDGTPCGGTMICVASVCLPSRCGDMFVSAGEDCDDGNEVDGDACPGDCKYACTTDAQCNDGNSCSIDKCDLAKHVCAPKTAVTKGTACVLPSSEPGVCNGTSCSSATCGNSSRELTEECDDGNTVDTDGCKSDCTFTCKIASDCDDKNPCNGVETCDTVTHRCRLGTAKVCNDSSSCTSDRCSTSTGQCVYTLIDNDGDGVASSSLGSCGRDCHDRNPSVRPGQTNWFLASYTTPSGARSWDYDCDGTQTRRFNQTGACTKSGSDCIYRPGWVGAVPACGSGDFWVTGCGGGSCREEVSTTKYAQECR
jgi:cysteine-rich repeat protein